MVVKVGILGLTEGNGHPFSFSAIINGYSEPGLARSGWKVIYDYVRQRDRSEFGVGSLQVTHAWTQDEETTKRLCEACLIPHCVPDWKDLVGEVDVVIIARDDHENHFSMAMPFLEAGLHVFVDKPLSLVVDELKVFRPYLESGKLMSCSGMRYARELDKARATINEYGALKLVRGAVVLSWEKYGVHLIDAIFGMLKPRPVAVTVIDAEHMSVAIQMDEDFLLQLDALGEVPKTFRIDIWGKNVSSTHEITDNFSMFRRMLWDFSRSIETDQPVIPAKDTLDVMRLLMAARIARTEKRRVFLDEIQI